MLLQHKSFHSRFILLLIITLNTLDKKEHNIKHLTHHKTHFEIDLKNCHMCFKDQIQHCLNFFEQLQTDNEFSIRQLLDFFPKISFKRNNHALKLITSNEKIIAKYFYKQNEEQVQGNSDIQQVKTIFLQQQENLQGMQYAPSQTINNFVNNLQQFHENFSEIMIWNYLLNNIQPLIYPILNELNFPVPRTYAVCGFTLYQQYAGEDLHKFFKADFSTKLEISKQLLEAAIRFSFGFRNYRLYITDLTADNIVYDRVATQIYFIDLDTIFIVDSTAAKYKSTTHKHIYIQCPGCFAYSAHDIASYNISDVNIFLVCQFLREDLYNESSKGFLYPIPFELSSAKSILWLLLDKCVDCPENLCSDRFAAAKELIQLFEEILHNSTDSIKS